MPLRTDVEKALAELVADEAGPKFQGLAVVLAKQKWPRLVASERKWDLGLDAYASGDLEPDGNGFGLACSLPGKSHSGPQTPNARRRRPAASKPAGR